jgi:deoxyribodipyrimidine photo-lyase
MGMPMEKSAIAIVWFKRDLRLFDHQPLVEAMKSGIPLLLLYVFEPTVCSAPDVDQRHIRFILSSIEDMNGLLPIPIRPLKGELIPVLEEISSHYTIRSVYAHMETGNAITFARDRSVQAYCSNRGISCKEYPTNGVIRGLKNRKTFHQQWEETMRQPAQDPDLSRLKLVDLPAGMCLFTDVPTANPRFQPGGTSTGNRYLDTFLFDRRRRYSRDISKPLASRKSCSRISPYLAWGNLSMRQVYQRTLEAMEKTGDRHNLRFFISRLHWHCHFIQKFESECRMEFENLNPGFNSIRVAEDPVLIRAWEEGLTGYPLIDACIRCVRATGYLNFRMRSMLVSFLTHHLWQPWQAGAHFLARQFLDYEPGIHYPQFQMQAGTMGVHTIRIYNPVRQSHEQDPEALFIREWVPELAALPTPFVHEPWLLTPLEQESLGFRIGQDYPKRIVDIEETGRFAREELWKLKGSATVKKAIPAILKKHTSRREGGEG